MKRLLSVLLVVCVLLLVPAFNVKADPSLTYVDITDKLGSSVNTYAFDDSETNADGLPAKGYSVNLSYGDRLEITVASYDFGITIKDNDGTVLAANAPGERNAFILVERTGIYKIEIAYSGGDPVPAEVRFRALRNTAFGPPESVTLPFSETETFHNSTPDNSEGPFYSSYQFDAEMWGALALSVGEMTPEFSDAANGYTSMKLIYPSGKSVTASEVDGKLSILAPATEAGIYTLRIEGTMGNGVSMATANLDFKRCSPLAVFNSSAAEGSILTAGSKLNIEAAGFGEENAAPSTGDFRYVAVGWSFNGLTGTFTDGKAEMTIDALANDGTDTANVEKTLEIAMAYQVYNGTWETKGEFSLNGASFKVPMLPKPTPTPSVTTPEPTAATPSPSIMPTPSAATPLPEPTVSAATSPAPTGSNTNIPRTGHEDSMLGAIAVLLLGGAVAGLRLRKRS
ncbi:hypothetical protein [Gehongia tenuis]|uniref:Gram-positive cocci surface proteins LPxTG domain-containing protein n=1 Tax=Gehongia tenuis TaxID=2763655 RepID=A0A926D6M9_9FIRM|nr:hypothetical protein [Gehongia tenuis]MBC8531824.1 hypothetical protein [Gehongia tenuis]